MSVPASHLLRLSFWMTATLSPALPAVAQSPAADRSLVTPGPSAVSGISAPDSQANSNKAGISGVLTDGKGETVINGLVVASEGGIQKGGSVTDLDGRYTIAPLAPGRYTVTFSYLGRKVIVNDVIVAAGTLSRVNEAINVREIPTEFRCIFKGRPMLNPANPTMQVRRSDQIERLAR